MAFKQAVGKLKEAMAADQAQDFTAAAAHYAAGLALLTEAADAPAEASADASDEPAAKKQRTEE